MLGFEVVSAIAPALSHSHFSVVSGFAESELWSNFGFDVIVNKPADGVQVFDPLVEDRIR